MAELNDFFIRSLRNSTRQRNSASANGSVVGKLQTQSIMTGRHSSGSAVDSSGTSQKREVAMNNRTRHSASVPPDLLANLLPRRQDEHTAHQPSKSNPLRKAESDHVSASAANVNRISTKLSTPKKLWNSFTSKCITTSSVYVVKEYQPPAKPVLTRRNSVAAAALLKSEAPLRIVPTWFPPANIPKLNRQGSFHGETAASRLLRAKQRSMDRAAEEHAKNGSLVKDTATSATSPENTSTPTIPEEPDGTQTVTGPKRPPRLHRPHLTIDTRPASPSPAVCARHVKHHSAASQSAVAAHPKSADLRNPVHPGSPSASKRYVDIRGGRPRTVFKFGTLPRSFRMSSSHSPSHSTHQLAMKPSASSCDLCEPKTAPIVQCRISNGRTLQRSQSYRNSWHVTSPLELAAVKRPDVAVSNDPNNVWISPLVSPVAPQKICTCGDTRKHVHLVKFGEDLTLTDTRYFVEDENGEITVVPQSVPVSETTPRPVNTSKLARAISMKTGKGRKSPPPPPVAESESESESSAAHVPKSSTGSRGSSSGISTEEETLQKEVQNLKNSLSPRSTFPEMDSIDVLSGTIADVQQEIDSFSNQDKSMLRRLLDLSDQVRHWSGRRKHRIRSVDSISPLLSGNDTGKEFPVLAGSSCQLQSIPELRRSRTLSMEDIGVGVYRREQVTDKAPFALIRDSVTSASQLRSNVHLSYSDLLKNSSKFWQPSQPGCNNETSTGNQTVSACILQEASLSLLL